MTGERFVHLKSDKEKTLNLTIWPTVCAKGEEGRWGAFFALNISHYWN